MSLEGQDTDSENMAGDQGDALIDTCQPFQ